MDGRRGWDRGVLALGAVCAGMVAFVLAARLGTLVERGALISWLGDYEVERRRVLGVEVIVDRSGGTKDLLTGLLLLAVAGLGLAARARLRAAGSDRSTQEAFAVLAAGTTFLAVDEVLAVHETVGHNLGGLRALPGVGHPDDTIMAVYALGALVLGWHHRHVLRGAPRATMTLALAAGMGVAAQGVDLLGLEVDSAEELLELACGLAGLAGLLLLVHERCLVPSTAPASVRATAADDATP